MAETLYLLGRATARGGDYAAAEPLFRQALELRRELFGEEDRTVAISLNSLALVLHEKASWRRPSRSTARRSTKVAGCSARAPRKR